MNTITELLIKLRVFTRVSNWQELLQDYFGVLNKPYYTVGIGNILLTLRSKTTDKWTVHETVLRDDYRLKEVAPYAKVIIDLGASSGAFTLLAAQSCPQAKVYAFEPEPDNNKLLERNVKNNNLTKRVITYATAIHAMAKTMHLEVKRDVRSHRVWDQKTNNSVSVKTTTLESVLGQNKIKKVDLLKMDIEGSEYDVLYSLPKKVALQIQRMSIEYHNDDPHRRNGTYLSQHLRSIGFIVEKVDWSPAISGMIYAKRI